MCRAGRAKHAERRSQVQPAQLSHPCLQAAQDAMLTEPDTSEAAVQCSLGEVLLVKPAPATGAEGELQLVEAASLQQPLHLMQQGVGNLLSANCMLTEFNTQASA